MSASNANKVDWKYFDAVAACMANKISMGLHQSKRFYRMRSREGTGIYDLAMQSPTITGEVIFSSEFEREYRLAGNDLRKIETAIAKYSNSVSVAY